MRFIFWLILIFYALSPFLYIIRSVLGDDGIVSVLLRIQQPILIIVLCITFYKKTPTLDYFSFFNIIFSVYGLIIGLFHNEYFHIISTLSHSLLGVLIYLYFKNTNICIYEYELFFNRLLKYYITTFTIVIILMYSSTLLFSANIYKGLACQLFIFGFFYSLFKKRTFLCFLILILVFLSGKRGVLISLLLPILIFYFPLLKLRPKFTSIFSLSSIIFIFIILNYEDFSIFKKYTSGGNSINHYSSGRLNELISAFDYWIDDIFKLFVGSGFGFTYEYIQENKNFINIENYRNVHFSYINPLIIHGIILGTLYLLILFVKNTSILLTTKNLYLRISIISYLMYSCFVFNLFNEPIYWLLLGYLSSNSKLILVKT